MHMTWIVTADGHEASLELCAPADFEIGRIAHSLAQINRFNGHACRPYSVAEHSLLVCDIAERYLGLDVFGQFVALMHDAHEAYVGDVTTPVKQALGSAMQSLEARIEHFCALRFGYYTALVSNRSEVKAADLMALSIERTALLPIKMPTGMPSKPWPCLAATPTITEYDLMDAGRVAMTWRDWRDRFTERYEELVFARAELSRDRLERLPA